MGRNQTRQYNTTSLTLAQSQGLAAEEIALRYLEKHGLKLIQPNFQCLLGEIDLIMQDGEAVVFIEVRFRAKKNYGGALSSITTIKQRKIIKTARFYLQKKGLHDQVPCRFDVVAIDGKKLEWIPDAFQVQ